MKAVMMITRPSALHQYWTFCKSGNREIIRPCNSLRSLHNKCRKGSFRHECEARLAVEDVKRNTSDNYERKCVLFRLSFHPTSSKNCGWNSYTTVVMEPLWKVYKNLKTSQKPEYLCLRFYDQHGDHVGDVGGEHGEGGDGAPPRVHSCGLHGPSHGGRGSGEYWRNYGLH